ncbi:glucosyl transferase [archaeon]|nr:glucosyl transferase [archaeon]|tara:strand:+ start:6810 stop:7589 length:780 start_codon:yes stop_codon:yes gene_type:complete
MTKLSIVIPAYNEEKRIQETLDSYIDFFQKVYKKDFEIIIVLNGCTDNTLFIVKKYAKKHDFIIYRDFKEAIKKGGAVIEGFKIAKGDYIGFVDADNSTLPNDFNDLAIKMKESNFDVVVASRWLKDSIVETKQPLLKRIGSRGFNLLVNLLFNLHIKDSQCGAKIFKRNVVKEIIPEIGIANWAFDVNLLFSAKRKGYNIIEIPTKWNAAEASHFNLFKAIPEMFLGLIRLRLLYSPLKLMIKIYDKLPEEIKIHHRL